MAAADSFVGDGLAPSPYKEVLAECETLRQNMDSLYLSLRQEAIARIKAEAERDQYQRDYQREYGNTLYERSRAERAEAERDALRALLREARDDWIKVGYGASHEDVAACRDFCDRIDAALAGGEVMDTTSESASHFCSECGAWWLYSWDGTWKLRSEHAGEQCCNNMPMHGNKHIVSVRHALQSIANICGAMS